MIRVYIIEKHLTDVSRMFPCVHCYYHIAEDVMSSLYKIEVTGKPDPQTLIVIVKVIHPDAMKIPATPGFALMLLNDNAVDAPLRNVVDLETVMDEDWSSENAQGIVDSVELLGEKHRMPRAAERDQEHAFWKDIKKWPEAKLQIHCTHPAWCAHIKCGDMWETTAFDPSGFYEESAPILPETVDQGITLENTVEYSEGFLPVPKIFLFNGVPPVKLDDIVYIPAYNNPSYSVENRIEGRDAESFSFSAWLGKPVSWSSYGRVETGILADVSDNGSLRLVSVKGSSRCENNTASGDLEWIGTISFKKGKKKGRREINVSDAVYFYDGAVMSVKKEGAKLCLSIMNCGRYDDELQMNPARALAVLALPLSSINGFDTSSPLGAALDKIMKNKEVNDASEVYQYAADRFIKKYKLSTCGKKAEGLDDMSDDELIAYYNSESWPVNTLEIELTDAEWGAHMDDKTLFAYQLFVNDSKYREWLFQ